MKWLNSEKHKSSPADVFVSFLALVVPWYCRDVRLDESESNISIAMPISSSEALGLEIAERVTSVCSVLGAAFIISTFLLDRKFRKPINRLVFFAAWGNLFANVATLISRDGIKFGSMSPTCQFQAFLIHWYLSLLNYLAGGRPALL